MSEPWVKGIIKEWKNDIPNGELYGLIIHKEKSVSATVGRFAHSSGSKKVTWSEFLSGEIDELVSKTMGSTVLNEAKSFINKQST